MHEFFYKCEWAYSPYDGTRNAVYFPSLDRWHTLTEFWRRDDEQCQFRFNATESTEPEPVPEEFVPMSPMAIVERMRLPEPVRVEISWSLWHDKKTSSLHCSLAFPPVRCTTMEELGKDRSALDQFLAEC
ncbi:MAG: hypothetical protein JSS66_05560 [Armatimonadetes bacterium]|nr:hypothetical protein [Armatimonadota bacterium]